MTDFSEQRERMVRDQIAARGLRDPRLLEALRSVPREAFVSRELAELAYADTPLPIGAGQTISQPFIVALMIAAAAVHPEDKVLEIGTGSGYAAAVLARLAATVFTIERERELADAARRRLLDLGFDNVQARWGDGTRGWPEQSPFDAILVTAGAPQVPGSLLFQLELGGRLMIPVGPSPRRQQLLRVVRHSESEFVKQDLGGVLFVPLVGAEGWPEELAPALVTDQRDAEEFRGR